MGDSIRPACTGTVIVYFSKTGRYDSGWGLQSGHSSKQSLPSFSIAKINAVPLQVWHTNNLTHVIMIALLA